MSRRGATGQACAKPVLRTRRRRGVRFIPAAEQLDRVAVGVTQVNSGAALVEAGVDRDWIGDAATAGGLRARGAWRRRRRRTDRCATSRRAPSGSRGNRGRRLGGTPAAQCGPRLPAPRRTPSRSRGRDSRSGPDSRRRWSGGRRSRAPRCRSAPRVRGPRRTNTDVNDAAGHDSSPERTALRSRLVTMVRLAVTTLF